MLNFFDSYIVANQAYIKMVMLLAGMAAIPRVLTDDQSVIAMARTAWIFVAVMQPLNGAVFSLEGIMMGAEDFRFLRNWTLLAAISAAVTSAVVVWGGFGVLGLWVAMEVLMLLRFVPTWLRLRGDKWLTFGVAS
jgi:Na+-driven multidrug efflux pump